MILFVLTKYFINHTFLKSDCIIPNFDNFDNPAHSQCPALFSMEIPVEYSTMTWNALNEFHPVSDGEGAKTGQGCVTERR